ncbi:hypothetical protein [Acidaminococcus sp.]|uniref:hypothetical protein n=1 Tax=Acidaminococcus sp. TaxID=1872103 RepID=UPI003D7D0617
MWKRILTFCLVVVLGCFAVTAQAADRWKWYHSSDYHGYYYDTQTVTYDTAKQYATVWIKILKADGSLDEEQHRALNYGYKATLNFEYVYYQNGYPRRYRPSKPYVSFVVPDSSSETLTRMVANQLGIRPMYPGGDNRWKWVRATDTYSLYVAKDTLLYRDANLGYTIWAKRVYLNGGKSKTMYFCNTVRNVVATRYSRWNSPLPDSDEEAVLNAVKALNVGA